MRSHLRLMIAVALVALFAPWPASAQINFQKTGYYLALGDSVSAGEGALPVTHGFVYQLYDQGVFGQTQTMDFANIAIKGATADVVQTLQVPEALCIQPPTIGLRPSVITLTTGANDFFDYIAMNGFPTTPQTIIALGTSIADKVALVVRSLVFGIPNASVACLQSGIPGIKVLVFNYYDLNHPVPEFDAALDLALQAFSARLSADLVAIQGDIATAGLTARVGFVDTFSAMQGREGLLLIEKLNGFISPFDFEIHPTNAGHTVIAHEFEKVWKSLQ